MTKKIIFEIDPQGNASVKDAIGFGSGCQEATKSIEGLLGKVQEDTRAQTEHFDELPEQDLHIEQ